MTQAQTTQRWWVKRDDSSGLATTGLVTGNGRNTCGHILIDDENLISGVLTALEAFEVAPDDGYSVQVAIAAATEALRRAGVLKE